MSSKIKEDLDKFLLHLHNEDCEMISVNYVIEKLKAIFDGTIIFHPLLEIHYESLKEEEE